MLLLLGDTAYKVRSETEPLHLDEQPRPAICDHEASELIISSKATPQQLNAVLSEAIWMIYQQRSEHEPGRTAAAFA